MLHDDEPPAWEVINAQGSSRLVLVCDHASPTAPLRLQNLGITEEQLTDHIGWDGGAADVARNLSARLQAPLLLTNYSRLVIDCNRPLENKDSIPEQSDGITIPGNTNLTREQRIERQSQLFHPYHQDIETLVDERLTENPVMFFYSSIRLYRCFSGFLTTFRIHSSRISGRSARKWTPMVGQ